MDKRTFKICEAEAERKMALETIPKLPSGWMQMKHRWDASKR